MVTEEQEDFVLIFMFAPYINDNETIYDPTNTPIYNM